MPNHENHSGERLKVTITDIGIADGGLMGVIYISEAVPTSAGYSVKPAIAWWKTS